MRSGIGDDGQNCAEPDTHEVGSHVAIEKDQVHEAEEHEEDAEDDADQPHLVGPLVHAANTLSRGSSRDTFW
jgi:hypothetical protein